MSVNKIKDVPLQVSSKSEAEMCDEVGSSSFEASAGTCAGQILISLLTKASLSQLWGMLNSQQIVVHLPMFRGLKFPANAMMIMEQMISLATFDLIPTSFLDDLIYYWPESDPFNVNFEMAGIEYLLLL